MICHYVTEHSYKLPEDFVRAVMETDSTMLPGKSLESAAVGVVSSASWFTAFRRRCSAFTLNRCHDPQSRKLSVMFSTGLLLVLLTLLLAYLLTGLQSRVNRNRQLPVIGAVNDFTLTNQANAAVTLTELRGKVWIADIIFTRCTGPCLKMTRQ